jgi:hypothetical protein
MLADLSNSHSRCRSYYYDYKHNQLDFHKLVNFVKWKPMSKEAFMRGILTLYKVQSRSQLATSLIDQKQMDPSPSPHRKILVCFHFIKRCAVNNTKVPFWQIIKTASFSNILTYSTFDCFFFVL